MRVRHGNELVRDGDGQYRSARERRGRSLPEWLGGGLEIVGLHLVEAIHKVLQCHLHAPIIARHTK